jgi:uncharacterized protein YbjT (DUF2867 family)
VRILVVGASGFIGARLTRLLALRGHEVVCGLRSGARLPADLQPLPRIEVDLATLGPGDRCPFLCGMDALVNCVGIFRESDRQSFEALHVAGSIALFDACVAQGVSRVVQVSALGADAAARSRFHLSKRKADQHLLSLPLSSAVAMPSLVYGRGGASATLFNRLASLPVAAIPAGDYRVQPIHVDDACEALARLVERADSRGRFPLVGARPLRFAEWISALRAALGLGRARIIPIPMGLARVFARVFAPFSKTLPDTEALDMLARGNTADPAATEALLHRAPRAPEDFIDPADAPAERVRAKLGWLIPLLRLLLAFVWIAAGVVSLGLFPVEQSYELLAATGVPRVIAPVFLYGAAGLDLAMGIATLAWPRRALWLSQLVLMVAYTLIITWKLPAFWLHPFGPVVKNAAVLGLLALLLELDPEPWITRP